MVLNALTNLLGSLLAFGEIRFYFLPMPQIIGDNGVDIC
jgi:hypothetical protein